MTVKNHGKQIEFRDDNNVAVIFNENSYITFYIPEEDFEEFKERINQYKFVWLGKESGFNTELVQTITFKYSEDKPKKKKKKRRTEDLISGWGL